ncbi:TetR/AcrR family transcriptional regulator [Herbiconiux sp. CPCC 205763]|uniref:TetR/AcrR family transcriptional regulator n=1 Tax=Herbiconiux aconitum TaxID=2970913 RepID=A0ABT2GYV6_9MICO|nr:TetR/AcrR family transcriptional regulator [Herbiconiux aconitum]MCS5720151.1 TetR/AcrR family transcriptional regulator [Herbiconiux aconitum]
MSTGSTSTARRGPGAKSAERRRSIIDAAHAVFAERGYNAGSFQAVADRVGMSQTGLLHYFPAKSDLLLAVLQRRDEVSTAAVDPTAGFAESVLLKARANERIPGVIQLYAVLSGESTTEGHPARAYFTTRFDRLRTGTAAELRALQADGLLGGSVDVAIAAASLAALWDGLQLQWLLAPGEVDVVACLRDYLDGLFARP